jgi:hypothetical protein
MTEEQEMQVSVVKAIAHQMEAGAKRKFIKVFISQPMRSKTPAEIQAERSEAIKAVHDLHFDKEDAQGYEILDSYFKDFDGNRVQFLGKSISLLGEADVVVFCRGWALTPGCRMEEMVAKEYEIERIYL